MRTSVPTTRKPEKEADEADSNKGAFRGAVLGLVMLPLTLDLVPSFFQTAPADCKIKTVSITNYTAIATKIVGPAIFEDPMTHGDLAARFSMFNYLKYTQTGPRSVAHCYSIPSRWMLKQVNRFLPD